MKVLEGFQKMDDGFDLSQALAEAGKCLLCHDAPCSTRCPAGTDPGAFIRKLRFGNVTGAIRTIKSNNILGGACGVLCPTARLCEKECVSKGLQHPVRIGRLQRFLVEHAWETKILPFREPLYVAPKKRSERVAIIGAGPAGLSCAAELAQNGIVSVIFEARSEPGGVLRWGVPSFRLHPEFLKKELGDLKDLGVEIRCSQEVSGAGAIENLLKKEFSAVFIAVGMWESMRLRPGRPAIDGVWTATEFLASLRDKAPGTVEEACRGKTIAVIGGGSVAIDCARAAQRLGARDVQIVYRRSYAQMPAEEDERVEALREGINLLPLQRPVDFLASVNGKLTGLKLIRTRLGDPDRSGRRAPQDIPGSEWTLDCDLAIEAIGTQAPKESPEWYPSVKLDNSNRIVTDERTRATSVPGLFAGGDIVRGPDLVVDAVEDGKRAARGIIAFLDGKRK